MTSDERLLTITSRLRIPLDEFEFTFARSSGPGGQNVNKVSSKALLRWPAAASPALPADVKERLLARYSARITGAGEILITSQRYRDQGRNIDDCLEKLREMLLSVATAPRKRRALKVSRAAKMRRLDAKRVVSDKKRNRRGKFEE